MLKIQGTFTKKQTTLAKKKPTHGGVKATPNAKTAVETPDLETMPDEIKTLAASHEPSVKSVPTNLVYKILSDVTDLMNEFQAFSDNNLTQEQRRRKIGAGVRNTVIPLIKKSSGQGAKNAKSAERSA